MGRSLKYRSEELELMDDLEVKGHELEQTLEKIESVNKYLGGISSVLGGLEDIKDELKSDHAPVQIIDMGCGSGDILFAVDHWLQKSSIKGQSIGIDANEHIVALAKKAKHTNVRFEHANVFDFNVMNSGQTIVLCSLFLHHFKDEEIITLFRKWKDEEADFVIVNDLHRHRLSIFFFKIIAALWRFPHMAKYDGELSIRRGFLKKELLEMAVQAGYTQISIKWTWAFRYKMILRK